MMHDICITLPGSQPTADMIPPDEKKKGVRALDES